MRILFLGNNWVGWQVLKWLKEQNETIVGLVIHPRQRRRYGEEILQAAKLERDFIFDAQTLNTKETKQRILELKPDLGISVLFGYILKQDVLDLFPSGCINLHPSYLPYNRGPFPNVWSIVDETTSGTTLHYIDKGIDTGDIIGQVKVDTNLSDTGETLYRRLEKASFQLFTDNWPNVRENKAQRLPQDSHSGTSHRAVDTDLIDEIQLNEKYKASDLLNIIRARTFAHYRSAYILENNEKIFLRLQLIPEKHLLEKERIQKLLLTQNKSDFENKKTILFRVDMSTEIGSGHAMRCLALAQAWKAQNGHSCFLMSRYSPSFLESLKNENFEFVEISAEPGSEADGYDTAEIAFTKKVRWIIVDGYQFDAKFQRLLQYSNVPVVTIDDYGHAQYYYADCVINQNSYANKSLYEKKEPYTSLFLGNSYALLRKEYIGLLDRTRNKKIAPFATKILISMGGADPNNATLKVLKAIASITKTDAPAAQIECTVVLGSQNKHLNEIRSEIQNFPYKIDLISDAKNMHELMEQADLGILNGGSTCWEAAFMGLPCLILTLTHDQQFIAKSLHEKQVAQNLGWHHELDIDTLKQALISLQKDATRRELYSKNGQQLIDGNGCARVLAKLDQNLKLKYETMYGY